MHDSLYQSKYGSVDKLKIATINISENYFQCIDDLVNLGFFPSRSEVIREAIKQFLNHEATLMDNLHNFHDIKQHHMEKILQ